MKNKIILSLAMLASTLAMADQCLSPNAILIHQGKPGEFTVDLPKNSGFTLAAENVPITGIGTISFSGVGIESRQEGKTKYGPYYDIFAYREIMCWYQVLPANGMFTLTKNNSQNHSYDLSAEWFWFRGFGYVCEGSDSACSFVVH